MIDKHQYNLLLTTIKITNMNESNVEIKIFYLFVKRFIKFLADRMLNGHDHARFQYQIFKEQYLEREMRKKRSF